MHIEGLDLKTNLTYEHLTIIDITKLFGNVNKFKTTNPTFFLERLYWRVYGIGHLTNNEIMVWLVIGWIVECNGHKINWAKTTTSIAKEKTWWSTMNNYRKALKMERLELSESLERSQGALATWVISINLGNTFTPQNNHKSKKNMVSIKVVANVQRLLELKHELWIYSKARV